MVEVIAFGVNPSDRLWHPIEENCTVDHLLTLFVSQARLRMYEASKKEAHDEQPGNQEP